MEKYKLIQGVNDVKTLYPELMVDWDYDNNTRNPESLLSNSNYDANWVCHKCGHRWKSRLDSRTKNKHGCPVCAKTGGCSINDYTLYTYISSALKSEDVFYRYNVLRGIEADVFIKSKNTVIEYDGYGFHKNTTEKDKVKENLLKEKGYNVYKFIERSDRTKTYSLEGNHAIIPEISTDSFDYLKFVIINVLDKWGIVDYSNRALLNNLTLEMVRSKIVKPVYRKSLKYILDNRKDIICTEGKIKTEDIYASSRYEKYSFSCDKGHNFYATPRSISEGYGCPICSGRIRKGSDTTKFLYNLNMLFGTGVDDTKRVDDSLVCSCPFCGDTLSYYSSHLRSKKYMLDFCDCTISLKDVNVFILGLYNKRYYYAVEIVGRYFLCIADDCRDDYFVKGYNDEWGDLNVSLFKEYVCDPILMLTSQNSFRTVPINKKVYRKIQYEKEFNEVSIYSKLRDQSENGFSKNRYIAFRQNSSVERFIDCTKDIACYHGIDFVRNRTVSGINTSLYNRKYSFGVKIIGNINESLRVSRSYLSLFSKRDKISNIAFFSECSSGVEDIGNGFFEYRNYNRCEEIIAYYMLYNTLSLSKNNGIMIKSKYFIYDMYMFYLYCDKLVFSEDLKVKKLSNNIMNRLNSYLNDFVKNRNDVFLKIVDCGNCVKIVGNYSWVMNVDKSVVYDILNIIVDVGYTLHSVSWKVGADSFKLIKSFVPGEYDLIFI